MAKKKSRNDALFDRWSIVHFTTSGALCWLLGPWWALAITTAWEPFEIFVLSPFVARFGIEFGYETWRNSASDIAFNSLGIALVTFIG